MIEWVGRGRFLTGTAPFSCLLQFLALQKIENYPMKKVFALALILFVVFASHLHAANGETIIASNVPEFLRAIGSNRTIILKPGDYDLSAYSGQAGASYFFRDAYDGAELVISEVANLTIRGEGLQQVHLITKPQYGNVLVFEACADITLENIKAGHGPEKGYCTGGVLKLDRCANIIVRNCLLYGSGIEGITAEQCASLQVQNTTITGCTYSIFSISECADVAFEACKFFDNVEFDLVNIRACSKVHMTNCKFRNNRASLEWVHTKFFLVEESADVLAKKCSFENNVAKHFMTSEGDVVLKKCKQNGNNWAEGSYQGQ